MTTKRAGASSKSTPSSKPRKPSKSVAPAQAAANSADQVDAQLAKYRSMRHFDVTAEPAGAATDGTASNLPFCIQKHAASHLHYDFRLGWHGVLKSWACAKGPSYVVADKRLAVQVEDHPMEYGGFEGIIPAGQYGGGTVLLWDQGTWAPQPGHEDIDAGLRDGQLKFLMFGGKMHGKWALIRMGGKAATERKPNWLLIKEHDEFEQPASAPAITDTEPRSVATGRTMEEIAAQKDHVWNSKETAGTGQAWYRQAGQGKPPAATPDPTAKSTSSAQAASKAKPAGTPPAAKQSPILNGLPKELQPTFIKPQLALEATEPPESPGWLHELKLDGYRMQARKSGAKVQMLTRSGLDWTHRIPSVAAAVATLSAANLTLDGEVVVLAPDGTTNFAQLQASFQEGAANPLTFFVFDLLHLDGRNPRDLPLRARKQLLAPLLPTADDAQVRLSEHIEGSGAAMFRGACELHAEGILSKRADAAYHSGRSGDWLKSKCLREQEFVVGGFTLSSDGDDRIGSLLLGYYRDGTLIYAGRTGTGFTQKLKRSLRQQFAPLEIPRPPFKAVPTDAKRGALWLRPDLVAQVRFATWTAEDLVRQAAFLGMREDKKPTEVVREEPTVAPKPKQERPTHPSATKVVHTTPRSQSPSLAPAKFDVRPRRPLAASPGTKPNTKETPKPTQTPAELATAWALMEHAPVRLTHPSKTLDTETGTTKQMLADFYWAVADRMLPHIAGRPLSLVRCPEGSAKPCFYQKHVNHMLPNGVTGVPVPDKKTGVPGQYITLDSREALAGLAQMGVLEIHPWGSRNTDLEHADRIILDLDPDESLAWSDVTAAAEDIRKRLAARNLKGFLKTTGGKGLHVVIPIAPTLDWDGIKQWSRTFVTEMERAAPTRYLTKMTKAARTGKIYLDYLRNERGATAVAPYSPRARAGLGVSLPLRWTELHTPERPTFRVLDFPAWRARLKSDPWATMKDLHQQLP